MTSPLNFLVEVSAEESLVKKCFEKVLIQRQSREQVRLDFNKSQLVDVHLIESALNLTFQPKEKTRGDLDKYKSSSQSTVSVEGK